MGKQKGQTHDYRIRFQLAGGTRPDQRSRVDYSVALLIARKTVREGRSPWSVLVYVDPYTGTETEIVRYDAKHLPPARDDDIYRGKLDNSRVWHGVPAGAYACQECGRKAIRYSNTFCINVDGYWRPKVVCPNRNVTAGVRRAA
ncbi:MAG TPA: hypothetical protein VFG15_30340 [Amycolatopsis sp.]|nr:hypothetical protein [Amycolatopsis sp.]